MSEFYFYQQLARVGVQPAAWNALLDKFIARLGRRKEIS